jgi:hypothetical protein
MMIPKTVLALALITIISITPAFAESIAVEVNGVMKVNHAVSYTSTGIKIESVSADLESIALIFQVLVSESESEGDINIKFDRGVFDAKIGDDDDEFFIIADGEEIKFEEEKDDISRTLSFSIPQGTEEFEIFGTIIFDESFLLKVEELEKAAALKEDEKRKEFYESVAAMEEASQRINDRIAAEKASAEEEARIAVLMDACGDGTVYVDGECVNEGLIGPQSEPIDSGPLINSIFAAMGIGLVVMLILWGIGKARHKERSVVESDNS